MQRANTTRHRRRLRAAARVGVGSLALLTATTTLPGCFRRADPGPVLITPPDNRARCLEAATHHTPLVTEWSGSEKANLESMLRSGGVAVEYSGCEMRIVSRCRVGGHYRWQRTTPAVETLEIANKDELYLKLPLGAVTLESELARSGSLSITTHVSGHMRLEEQTEQLIDGAADCARATHIIEAVAVGAYALRNEGQIKGGGTATVKQIGGGGANVERNAQVLRSAGAPDRCGEATELGPHQDCASPIQVFLWPLPGRAADVGRPGTLAVDFVAGDNETQWRVQVGDETLCTTPCTSWVDPSRPVTMTATNDEDEPDKRKAPWEKRNRVRLTALDEHVVEGAGLQVRAYSSSPKRALNGVAITASGGALVFVGGFLGLFGGMADSPGIAIGGAAAAAAGVALLAGGIVVLKRSRARAETVPRRRAQLQLTPGGLRF